MPDRPPLPPTSRTSGESSIGLFVRQRRITDFVAVAGGGGVILMLMGVFGVMPFWAAVLASALLIGFAFFWYSVTTPLEREALEAADEAADVDGRAEAFARERAFRAAMIDALPEAAMYIDSQGRVELANAAARRQFRILGPDPLISAVVRKPEVLDAVDAARQGKTSVIEFIQRDETDRFFACVAAPMTTETTSGVLVSLHDLTAIRRAEFARVDFLANASHELRTPLTALAGFIETLRGPAKDDADARERFLEIMSRQTDRMSRLINDLLSLSRIELIEHKPPEGEADLAAVVSEVGDALLPVAAGRNVKLRISGPASGVLVTGVRDELSQVAQNLIDNAIKYSEAGGVVEVEVLAGLDRETAAREAGRRWTEASHMSISTLPPALVEAATGRYAVLRVVDAGPGIDRQHLPRLAERFYRVEQGREQRKGTGLGLAIVKHVIARHRGEFLVESEIGRGSAFGVILPATQPAARQPDPVAAGNDTRASKASATGE